MTPEQTKRLAEIRDHAETYDYMLDGMVEDLLAMLDAALDGSALRQAAARERDALQRAGDAEAALAAALASLNALRDAIDDVEIDHTSDCGAAYEQSGDCTCGIEIVQPGLTALRREAKAASDAFVAHPDGCMRVDIPPARMTGPDRGEVGASPASFDSELRAHFDRRESGITADIARAMQRGADIRERAPVLVAPHTLDSLADRIARLERRVENGGLP